MEVATPITDGASGGATEVVADTMSDATAAPEVVIAETRYQYVVAGSRCWSV